MNAQVDMSCLTDNFRRENEEYYLHTSQWMKVGHCMHGAAQP
jgi:hypothetical protein